eukprot:1751929-Rhodomonas_salina.4
MAEQVQVLHAAETATMYVRSGRQAKPAKNARTTRNDKGRTKYTRMTREGRSRMQHRRNGKRTFGQLRAAEFAKLG